MRKLTDYEINVWYGHSLYQKLIGKGECQCEVCVQLRNEIVKGIKKI